MNTVFVYILSFTILIFVATFPTQFTTNNVKTTWYKCIAPSFSPPSYVFPIVWTILYTLLAIALAQTMMLPNSNTKFWLLGFYAYNLAQNMSWPYFFFELHEVKTALFVLVEMIFSTSIILWQSYRVLPPWVGHILVPYLLWLCFATILNTASVFKTCA